MKKFTLFNLFTSFFLVQTLLIFSNPTIAAEPDYPEKAISIVVPYGPGGMGDRIARVASEKLSPKYKQSLIVENRVGANGVIGSRHAMTAKPDGYTWLMGQTGEVVVNRLLIKDLANDPLKDLSPVVLIANAPLVLVSPVDSEFNTLNEFIEMARKNKGKFSFASLGAGSPGHLAAIALSTGKNIDMIHVPYKSISALMPDLIGGRINMFFCSTSSALPLINSGKLKVLAVSTPKRIDALPQVESVAESVLPGFSYTVWGGLFVTKGTPKKIIDKLNKDVNELFGSAEIKARFEGDNISVAANSVSEFEDFVNAEAMKYEKLIKSISFKIE